jgi:hypothetical protein
MLLCLIEISGSFRAAAGGGGELFDERIAPINLVKTCATPLGLAHGLHVILRLKTTFVAVPSWVILKAS